MLLHLMFCTLQNPSILYTSRKAQSASLLPLLVYPHLRLAEAIKAKLHLESLALASAKIAFVYFTAIYRG